MIIIFYNKYLKEEKEDISNFIKLRQSFYGNEVYGVEDFEKFKFLITLFGKQQQNYYLVLSGSASKEFLDSGYYDNNRVMDFIIYCYDKNKYLPLKEKYNSISMIEDENFDNVIEKIKTTIPSEENSFFEIKNYSSFLIEEEYKGSPLEKHIEMSKFFDENYETPSFNENIKKEIIELLNKIAQTKNEFEEAKEIIENIYDEKDLINCYTAESIIVYCLNKCLREVDNKFIKFAGLLNYALYKYYYDHPEINVTQDTIFYRKLIISIKDLYSYDIFENHIICFPSFTSTSIDENAFPYPEIKKHNSSMFKDKELNNNFGQYREKCVLLKIYYKYDELNQCPAFDIKYCSHFHNEKEFVFPPFSFFRILKFNSNSGTSEDPVVIELEVIPRKQNLERKLKFGGSLFYNTFNNCMDWEE